MSDEQVGLFHVPEASVRSDAGTGGKGSGGKGSGGSLGSGGNASGGSPMMVGKGGSGDGGRGMGGSGEDGGASMGGKASGGMPAMGGAASGGRAGGGGTSGSGGTSGGGGKATGGMMTTGGSGGAAGAGGGTGGAMQCPNYPTNDDCSKCICSKCKTQVASCVASGDATKDGQCKTIQECAEKNKCASTNCYCGSSALCLPPNGPCLDEINAAAGGGNPSPVTVQMLSNDTTSSIGRANAIGTCSTSNCKTECGL